MYQRGRNLYLHDHNQSRLHANVETAENGLRVDMDIQPYLTSPLFESLGEGVVRCMYMSGEREGYGSQETSSQYVSSRIP